MPKRIASIDQFRGYAIASMILVNSLGHFDAMPWMLKHHDTGFSYADLVAPVFIFVVGMGFRMSFWRRAGQEGPWAARKSTARRYCILVGLGMLYGGFQFRAGVWDALTDIGLSGLLALFFIDRGPRIRLGMAAAYLSAYQLIYSLTGYGEWVMDHSMNGGPLGPLSWVVILLLGSVAQDILATRDGRRIAIGCLAWGLGLTVAGWILSEPWPDVKASWPFSAPGMTAPYPLFSAGLAFLIYLGFHLLCDRAEVQIPHLSVMGKNPLVLYLLQAALVLIGRVTPSSAPVPVAISQFLVIYLACYATARYLDHKGIVVKV